MDCPYFYRWFDEAIGRRLLMVYLTTTKQAEPGYTPEIFQLGETLDVVSVLKSWVRLLPKVWGEPGTPAIEAS
jgi:hypothetical protein